MFGLLGRAFRTKVGIALIGALVVGGISAAALARPAMQSTVALANTGGSQTTTSSSTLATSGATASHDQSATPGTAPTTGTGAPRDTTPGDTRPDDTPTTAARPTATPRPIPSGSPTATATPLPQLEGNIVSTNPPGNSFVLGPNNRTVDVTSNTHFSGAASSLSTLGSGGYWTAEVRGVYESNGHFLAYSVDSCNSQYGC
jgi:hypothetical protein